MCILWVCKYANAKCWPKQIWQQSCWKFGDCKHVKHELPSCYGTVHIWHSLKDLKHWMCQNIDVTEILTPLESDIPWGTLNIYRTKISAATKHRPCQNIKNVETSTKLKHRPSWNIDQVETSTKLKHRLSWNIDQVEISTKLKHRPSWNIDQV